MSDVLKMILNTVESKPMDTAIWTEDGSFTYKELYDYSRRVAAALQKDGVVKGDVVTIELPRCREYFGFMLGSWMLGAAFVPSDSGYPKDRREYIAGNCNARVRVTPDYLKNITSDAIGEHFPNCTDEDLAVLIYTSGSTGKPKGVVHPYRSVKAWLERARKADVLVESDRFCLTAPFPFVVGVAFNTYLLTAGLPIYAIPNEARTNLSKMADFFAEYGITVTFLPPAMVPFFRQKKKTLREVFLGGEAAGSVWTDEFALINSYGMTETFSGITLFKLDKPYDRVPLGRPMDGVNLYLLDENGKEAEVGEICVSGTFATHYLGLEEQSSKTFVPNPFKEKDGFSTMVRTGDIGKRLPDGNIVYLERNDWMVNINGQRVEPGEIAGVLQSFPGVKKCTVKGFTGSDGQTFLCAYHVSDESVKDEDIREYLRTKLPVYMIPAYLMRMEALPLNVNGKVDRNKLPDPTLSGSGSSITAEHMDFEENVVTKGLREILKNVTGRGDYLFDENLIHCGISSLAAIKIASEVMGRFGVDLDVTSMLGGCSIASISDAIIKGLVQNSKKTGETKTLMESYPLTKTQMGIYGEYYADRESVRYNLPFAHTYPKQDVSADVLKSAVEKVIRAHPGLLCTISPNQKGEICMFPHPDAEPKVEMISGTEDDYQRYLSTFVRPFDLSEGLYRAVVFDAGDSVHLLTDFNHIMFDGTSSEVFIHDLATALSGGDVHEEGFTMFDLSSDEQERMASGAYDEGQKYYGDLLSDTDGVTLITRDVYGPTPVPAVVDMEVPVRQTDLKEYVQSIGATENAFFQSVMGYTLSRFNYTDDSCFTTVHSGRTGGRTMDTVGMLVKTFPVVFKFDSYESPKAVISRTKEQIIASMKNDIYPFSEISTRLGISSEVMFVYQAVLSEETVGSAIGLDDIQRPITVSVLPGDGTFLMRIEYDGSMYSKEIMTSFASAYARCAQGFLSMPDLHSIDLVDEDAVALVRKVNSTDADYDRSVTIVDMFRRRAEEHPDNIAVCYKDKKITYGEMDDLTDRLAAYINSKGIGKDEYVAILIPRCEQMPVTTMGVSKSGAAFQPLDPTYPVERLTFMMEDSKVRLLIADRNLRNLVPAYKGDVLYTDEIPSLPKTDLRISPSPEDAYIILYTSGTTGKPKGCVLEHRNIAELMNYETADIGMDADSKYANYASFGFDASMNDLGLCMWSGAALYVIPDEMRRDLVQMDEFYTSNGITHGFMTTQVGRMFMETTKCPTLKVFMTGGEALVPVKPPEGVRFINAYGPTECTVYVTSYTVKDDSPLLPIGKPNRNTRVYVLDKDLRIVPTGASGELYISGPQMFRGYLNNPEKTASAVIDNPFSDEPDHRRMYRTGDVVRLLPDGNVDYIGRRDGMVKVRGFRIELTEVEKVIREFKGIKDATVQAFDASAGGKYIAAYVVSDDKVDIDELNAFIASVKPPYMVPAVTMQLDEIPLNANSKVDKRKLPVPEMDFGSVTPPKNDVQQRIFDIVAEVIGTKSFGIETDIFQAGLTSIGSIRLNVLLSEAFGIPFQSKDLVENNTVEKLEAFIGSSAPAEQFEVLDDYPLTKSQEGVFVECMSKPDSTTYNIPVLLRYDRDIDIQKLKDALVAAVNAHPFILTKIFMDKSGDIRLLRKGIEPFAESDIEEITTGSLDEVRDTLVQPFQLMDSRLLRIKLIHADAEYVFIDIHHIIGDGTSLNIFLQSVSDAYEGKELKPEVFSGYEASLQEQKDRQGEGLEKARKYYDDLLAGYDRDFLPKGDVYHPDPAAEGILLATGAEGVAAKVEEYCRRTGITVNALICAAFGFNLSKYCGSDQSIFTTVYNGRNDSRKANTMSMFVKTLPVLCNMADDSISPLKFAGDIGKQLLDNMNNDIYSFAEISRELEVRPDVLFVYQGDTFSFDSFCGRPSELVPLRLSGEKEPILFQMSKVGSEFKYTVEFDKDRFTMDFMRFFTKSFDDAIWEFMTATTLREINLADERTMELVERFNDTDSEFDRSLTVVDLFRRNAKENPDRIAVVCNDDSLTYGEVDRITDYIAEYIHSKGIGTDQYVGVLVDRSVHMVVAAEGVIKSGAAYQPLDPTYPAERLLFMMEDSRVRLLILDRKYSDLVPGYKGEVLFLDELEGLCKGERPDVTAYAPKPEDALIILYTSGTTGTPKGCVLEHRNLSSFLNWMIPEVGLCGTSRYACYASFGFDACMMDIHASMSSGATVYIIPDEMRKDLAEIDKYFINNGITHGFMTTQMGRMFMETTKCRSLKAFMTGGEKLVPLNPPDWLDFYNIYGPTECTVDVTTYKVRDDSPLLPIGIPNTNVRIYVLDKDQRIVPAGSCGELCISGPQVFREYLNNPEKTAVTVIPNPYSDGKYYTRLYRTGDVVRLLPDGNIDYIGRRDGMVKVRGFRIELSEVEGIIREFEGIKDATVKAFDDPAGGKSITAYVVSDSTVDFVGLSDFIKNSKPPYMVPAHFIQLDAIPMTVNGKVDKRKLPEPTFEPQRAGRESTDPLEQQLCEIYANVLGLKKVYADDDFFKIGGTSISASKLVLSCMNAGIPIVYKNVFDNPSPEQLARFVRNLKPGEQEEEKRETVDEGPLSYNVESNLDKITSHPPRRILLTGATGYLGSHVLWELLRRNAKEIYCLVRSGKGQTSDERLRTVMMYYFGGMFTDEVYSRIQVIDTDITSPDLMDKVKDLDFDTVINCAAVVKHFAADDSIERVNVGGVENLIQVAKAKGALLVQVSTESVAGESLNGSIPPERKLREYELDIGQNLDNKYAASKFKAEKAMIEQFPNGLRGKIIRVGNLMSRDSDGEFQINFNTNAFMKQMRSYVKLGFFSVTDMDIEAEFSPIDMVAKAVVILAGTPDKFTVFHVNNCHKVHMANILKVMRDNDMPVEIVSRKVFNDRFMEALKDESKAEYVSGLISYLGNAGESRRFVAADESYTVKALYRLGFSWPLISEQYIDKAFKALKSMRFFK